MLQFSSLGDVGDQSIAQLQQALTQLSMASGKPGINPGPVNGVLNDSTMAAVAFGFDIIGAQMPWYARYPLDAALILGSGTDTARNAVQNNANVIAVAAIAASRVVTPDVGAFPYLPTAVNNPTTLLLLLFGGIVVWKLFLQKPKSKTITEKAA